MSDKNNTEELFTKKQVKKEPKPLINPFAFLIDNIRYRIASFRIGLMDDKSQHRIGKEIYSIAYQSISQERGDTFAACAVLFECPYDAHVSYHIKSTLEQRVNNENEAVEYYDIRSLDDNRWVVSVIACGRDQDGAMSIADSCAMSAVLSAPTAEGTFQRYVLALENYNKDDAEEFVSSHIMPLFDEYNLHTDIVEI